METGHVEGINIFFCIFKANQHLSLVCSVVSIVCRANILCHAFSYFVHSKSFTERSKHRQTLNSSWLFIQNVMSVIYASKIV